MVLWWDNSAQAKTLFFLVQLRDGLSWDLATRNLVRSVILDRPYGKDLKLKDYKTVLLFAKGIGIAGVLTYTLSLVERRNHKNQAVS
jgi:NAD(P)H-flavin reductase